MQVYGLEEVSQELAQTGYFVKCLLNREALLLFSSLIQHRDVTRHGLSYEDDYRGNAMAGIVKPGKIEVRFHAAFEDVIVKSLFSELFCMPEMNWASNKIVEYQGRILIGGY